MHESISVRAALRLVPVILAVLSGCASPPRLQTLGEAMNEMNRSNQAKMETQCGNDGKTSIDCRRKVREEFEQQRKKNDPAARN